MKKIMKLFLVILSSALVLTGCTLEPEDNGSGIVKVAVNAARGIEAVDMDTAYYKVDIHNVDKNTDSSQTFGVDEEIIMTVPTGSCEVKVTALNAEKLAIGYGSTAESVVVKYQEVTLCSVAVSEKAGKGNIDFTVNTTIDDTLTAKVYSGSADIAKDKALQEIRLVEAEDVFTGTVSLDNGYYKVVIAASNGNITAPESVRVVADYTAEYNVTVSDRGGIKVEIVNKVDATPNISLKGVRSFYKPDTELNITAEVTGMEAPVFRWYLDSVDLTDKGFTGAAITGRIPAEQFFLGTHVITCVATEGEKVWTEKVETEFCSSSYKPTEIDIPAGKLDIALIGDVLIPRSVEVEWKIDGQIYGYFDVPSMNDVQVVPAGRLTCSLKGVEGYSYYLESYAEADRTVVYVVLDKEIPDPGFMHVTYNQKFVLDEGVSRGLYLRASSTVFPTEFDGDPDHALIPINNRVKERTIKLDPDTYSQSYHSGSGASHAFWGMITPHDFTVAAGQTVEVEMGSRPFATVDASFPGLEDGRMVKIWYADGDEIDWNALPVKSGRISFYAEVRQDVKFLAVTEDDGMIQAFEATVPSLVEGQNTVEFTAKELTFVNSGVPVKAGETVYFDMDFRSIFPSNPHFYVGVDSFEEDYWFRNEPQRHVIKEDGVLRLLPLFLDGYEVSIVERQEKYNDCRIFDIIVDLPEADRIPVTIEYDFTYDAHEHRNMFPNVRTDVDGVRNYSRFSIEGARTSINFPAGEYIFCGTSIWSRGYDWNDEIYFKEDRVTVAPDVANVITLQARPATHR